MIFLLENQKHSNFYWFYIRHLMDHTHSECSTYSTCEWTYENAVQNIQKFKIKKGFLVTY